MNILIYTQCFAPKLGGIESVMTNIATQSSKIGHSVSVLADGSKSKSSSFDSQQNFEIKRFDQIKFFRNKIKSSFAYDLLKNKNFDLVFFDSWKSIEHFNGTNQIKKIFDNEKIPSCIENQGIDSKIIIINSFGNLQKYFRKSEKLERKDFLN